MKYKLPNLLKVIESSPKLRVLIKILHIDNFKDSKALSIYLKSKRERY